MDHCKWITASGENKAYYYAGPDAIPEQLTYILEGEATKYIYHSAINDDGYIVGYGYNGATLWLDKIPYSLTELSGMDYNVERVTSPTCINDNGDIVVFYTGENPVQTYAVISCEL